MRVAPRVISSTNRDLGAEIAAGRFRQELFDRLNVVPVAVPGLAERREDIGELARHFIDQFHAAQGMPVRELPDDAIAALQTMRWPGNIRQLINLAERAVLRRLVEAQGGAPSSSSPCAGSAVRPAASWTASVRATR